MTYTILHKDSHRLVTGMKNISLDAFCNFCTEHAHEMKFYDVKTSEDRKEVIFHENSEELELFKKSMALAQINDVSLGIKIIKFSSEIGYYLLRVKESIEYNISIPKKGDVIGKLQNQIFKCNDLDKLRDLCTELLNQIDNV